MWWAVAAGGACAAAGILVFLLRRRLCRRHHEEEEERSTHTKPLLPFSSSLQETTSSTGLATSSLVSWHETKGTLIDAGRLSFVRYIRGNNGGGSGASIQLMSLRPSQPSPSSSKGKEVCVKVFQFGSILNTSVDIQGCGDEVETLLRFNNRVNIVHCHGIALVPGGGGTNHEGRGLGIVFEYCENGDLASYLVRRGKKEGVKSKLDLCRCCAKAVEILHSFTPPYIHRDIKPSNYLVDGGGVAKLGDFGEVTRFSRRDHTEGSKHALVGSAAFMAPELIQTVDTRPERCVHYSEKVDIYALGMTMWTIMAAGGVPFGDADGRKRNKFDIYRGVLGGERPPFPPSCPSEMREVINRAWDTSPDLRPSAGDIVARLDQIRSMAASYRADNRGKFATTARIPAIKKNLRGVNVDGTVVGERYTPPGAVTVSQARQNSEESRGGGKGGRQKFRTDPRKGGEGSCRLVTETI